MPIAQEATWHDGNNVFFIVDTLEALDLIEDRGTSDNCSMMLKGTLSTFASTS